MNCNIYLYGEFEKGYTQYPDNYTQSIIRGVISKIKNQGKSQVAIYRNSDLAYLIYNYKYSGNKYIGFCMEFNKVCPHNVSYIFNFFDSLIADILNKGTLLHYSTSGNILPGSTYLYEQSSTVDYYSNFIRLHLDDKHAQFKKLPPINRSVDNDKTVLVHIDDPNWSVESVLNGYNTIIFFKDAEDTSIYSYKNVLKKLNEEKLAQIKRNQDLQVENAKLKREKNRILYVVILSLIVLVCGIGIYCLNDNLNHTQSQLTEANKDIATKTGQLEEANRNIVSKDSTISVKNETISSQKSTIVNLNDTVDKYKTCFEEETARRMDVEEQFDTYKSILSGYQPFIVKGTSFDFPSGKYTINYYGLTYGKYNFNFRVIFPDNTIKIYERSFWVYTGSDNITVSLSNSYDSGKYYTIEIMYNNRVIGGSRH